MLFISFHFSLSFGFLWTPFIRGSEEDTPKCHQVNLLTPERWCFHQKCRMVENSLSCFLHCLCGCSCSVLPHSSSLLCLPLTLGCSATHPVALVVCRSAPGFLLCHHCCHAPVTSLWVTALERQVDSGVSRARISQERFQFKPGRRDASFASRGAAWAPACEQEL